MMMKNTILAAVTAIMSVSAFAQSAYKPRTVSYMGRDFLVSGDIALDVPASSRGSHFACDQIEPTKYRMNNAFGTDYQAMGWFLGSGVNGFGTGCVVGSEKEVVAKVQAIRAKREADAAAKSAESMKEIVAIEAARKKEAEREALLDFRMQTLIEKALSRSLTWAQVVELEADLDKYRYPKIIREWSDDQWNAAMRKIYEKYTGISQQPAANGSTALDKSQAALVQAAEDMKQRYAQNEPKRIALVKQINQRITEINELDDSAAVKALQELTARVQRM